MKRFLWCYGLEDESPSEIADFSNEAHRRWKVTDAFVSMSGSIDPRNLDEAKLVEITRQIKPIRFHGMILQDPLWLQGLAQKEDRITDTIARLAQYNMRNPLDRIHGVHVDCEPHALPQFKAAIQSGEDECIEEQFRLYRKLLRHVRREIDSHMALCRSVMLSAATGWWYDRYPVATMRKLCCDIDATVPMAYRMSKSARYHDAKSFLNRLPIGVWEGDAAKSCGFILGMAVDEWPQLSESLLDIEEQLRNECPEGFRGVALFKNSDLDCE